MTDEMLNEEDGFDRRIARLSADVRTAARTMRPSEARYLVDQYYQRQAERTRSANQSRAAKMDGEASPVTDWINGQALQLEDRIRALLDEYSGHQPLGQACRANVGIGPVIAAGLLANIDMAHAPTTGHIWSFAGLDPRVLWLSADNTKKELKRLLGDHKDGDILAREDIVRICEHFRRRLDTIERFAVTGKDGKCRPLSFENVVKSVARRPWNGRLKVLCWKIGESFVKVSGKEEAFYGRLYSEYKAEEQARNAKGEFAQQAADKLERFNIGNGTDAYKAYSQGILPPAHIHSRAKRRVVKLFLSHYHEVATWVLFNRRAPKPWVLEHGGHTHYIAPPPAWGYTPE